MRWVLIVTGLFGVPGTESVDRFETVTKTQPVCQALEVSIIRTLRERGAFEIRTTGCPDK